MTIEIRTPLTKIQRDNVGKLEATMSDGTIGNFTLELLILNTDQLGMFPRGHTAANWLEVYRDGENVFGDGFGFFIEDVRVTAEGGGIISGRSYEVLLNDEKVMNFGTTGGDIATLAKYMLGKSSKVVYLDANIDDPSDTMSKSFRGESFFNLLSEISGKMNQWFYVRRYGDDFHGFLKNDRGEGSANIPIKTLTLGKEVSTNTSSSGGDTLRIINRQRVIGARGFNIDEIYNDSASQTKYGEVFEGDVIYEERVTTAAEAQNVATQVFSVFADPSGDVELRSNEFISGIHLGDYIGVDLPKQDMSVVVQPVDISILFAAGERDEMNVDFDFPAERIERMLRGTNDRAAQSGYTEIDKDYGGVGTYWIDTGWLQSNNGLTGTYTTQDAACTRVGGNCNVGTPWHNAFSYTLPTEFGALSNVYIKAILRATDDSLYGTCYGAECNDDPAEITCGRFQTKGDDFGFSGSDAADHGGHTIYIGMNGGNFSTTLMARFIVGWN